MGFETSKQEVKMPKAIKDGPKIVIALYRPKRGREKSLMRTVAKHLPALRRAKLVTARPSILMKAADGTLLEIFEWRSERYTKIAHTHPVIRPLWETIGRDADIRTLKDLKEAGGMFPHFTPLKAH